MKLEEITSGSSLEGVEPSSVVTVVAAIAIPPASLQLVYRLPDGGLRERLLTRSDEISLREATITRPWSFDGDGAAFKLTAEAKRIDFAFLFDPMMAVHTSVVQPLPHQITAVYESMLPRQPLRYVLADDPGAGKTIMAGLYIQELIMRADAHRVMIIAPGSLVEQWREELFQKFGLEFHIYSRELEAASPSGNAFEDHGHLIVRLDQLSRAEDLHDRVCATPWDLVVFDEAHNQGALASETMNTDRIFAIKEEMEKAEARIAMDAVRRTEEARGYRVVDVSAQKCGWDLTSYPPVMNGSQPDAVHIEVKGRIKGAATITVTHNEMLYALNQAEKFRLAIVHVGDDDTTEGPYYLKNPFQTEPGWGVSSVNFDIKALVERAEKAS